MNESVKAKWLAALRSGNYVQGKGALKIIDASGTSKFCCLGVLCDIVKDEPEVQLYWRQNPVREQAFIGDAATLPPHEVEIYAGLSSPNPPCWSENGLRSLSYYNDVAGLTFAEIADLIEKHL